MLNTKSGLYALTLIFCFFSISIFAQSGWELDYLHKLEDRRTEGKTNFYQGVSSSIYVFSIAAPASYLIAGISKKDKNLKKTALYITESIVVSQFISFSMKAIFNRERPGVKDPTLNPVNTANSASFPSGHTAAAFSLATSMSIVSPKWYVIAPMFTWASLVGYSRMYLGVHYPSDVLVGALVGSGSAWLTYKLNKWMYQPKKNKNLSVAF